MKTLTVLRHAKSDLGEPGQRDFDRTLNAKGQRAATTVGRHWRGLGAGFDAVVASPAARVRDTLEHFQRGYGPLPAPDWDQRVYLASTTLLLEVVHGAGDDADRLLLVGHNSGLEELVLLLAPNRAGDVLRDGVEEKFPTAAIAELTFAVAHWADVARGGGSLTRFVRPRDLDPALGPDR